MLRISNVKVYDLAESVIASGYSMLTEPPEFNETERYDAIRSGIQRLRKLAKIAAQTGIDCHKNALCGIRVSFDVHYPQYWSMEFQRYHFADIVTSSSKMHRLLKMDLNRSCNEYVTKETITNLERYIEEYNAVKETDGEEAEYRAWMKVLSNTPMGLELFMRVSTNYLQLATIYKQRRHHRLKEDWGAFCAFIEGLPYASDLITGYEV